MIKVTVWDEYIQSRDDERVKKWYPNGIHEYIASFLKDEANFEIRTACLEQEDHGLTDDVLNQTDVLIWWAHTAHLKVSDTIVDKIYNRVLNGMGIIFLHSAHFSKPFQKLMGTSCSLKWREASERERLWVIEPNHPLVAGIGEYIELENEEMYGEFFDIAPPDKLVMIGWFKGGEVFRSLCTWSRGYGKVVYFQPGHESHPTYHNTDIQKVIKNAVHYTYSPKSREIPTSHIDSTHVKVPLEEI